MGVSGCGKSAIGQGLAHVLGVPFQEGDALHPAANILKMTSGVPLQDADRMPWLELCRAWLAACTVRQSGGVLACSALRRDYRTMLAADSAAVRFAYIKVEPATLLRRLLERQEHFMPPSLLSSQLAILEEPGSDEDAVTLLNDATLPELVERLAAYFHS